MSDQPQLHSSIVAMISLASGIAAKHPDMGLCQIDRLRSAGVPEHQIDAVIEIARHIRDEAAEKLDYAFDEKARLADVEENGVEEEANCCGAEEVVQVAEENSCGCTPTASGQRCC